jgi:hypothetical protein
MLALRSVHALVNDSIRSSNKMQLLAGSSFVRISEQKSRPSIPGLVALRSGITNLIRSSKGGCGVLWCLVES